MCSQDLCFLCLCSRTRAVPGVYVCLGMSVYPCVCVCVCVWGRTHRSWCRWSGCWSLEPFLQAQIPQPSCLPPQPAPCLWLQAELELACCVCGSTGRGPSRRGVGGGQEQSWAGASAGWWGPDTAGLGLEPVDGGLDLGACSQSTPVTCPALEWRQEWDSGLSSYTVPNPQAPSIAHPA